MRRRSILPQIMPFSTSFLLLQCLLKFAFACTNGEYSPHPTDCNKYLVCSNGQEIEMSCNTGLWWNQQGKYCDYPERSGCTSGGQTTVPSSSEGPFTSTTVPPPPPTTTPAGGGGSKGSRTGVCSWYGKEGEIPPGWPTACGQPFDRYAMAAATWPEVPCGTKIRVTDMDTGKSVEVTVDDRFGGAPKERIVDLTYGAFGQLADREQGLIQNCRYDII